MIFSLLRFFALLTLTRTVWGAANKSFGDCQQVATQFANTVSNGPVTNIMNTTGVNVTCPQISNASCPGSMINGVCVWQQKLCVTCINGSTVRIRVQSNGLPRRCTILPTDAVFAERNIDFEVNFNPDVSVNSPNHAPSTAAALNNILCNISNHMSVPSTSAYTRLPASMPIDVLAGVAVDGVTILNVNSINQVDPFYPPPGYPMEGADQCLSHPTGAGEFHYHISSGCILNPPKGTVSGCGPDIGCANNISSYSISTFSAYRRLTLIGIAKDGHLIYGPYLLSGVQVTTGFDICNGMFYDSFGNYAYFATETYPYVTGCFGPGNYPSFTPNCTTNAPSGYIKSSFAASFSSSNTNPVKVLPWFSRFFMICLSMMIIFLLQAD
ncbi:unnamed protein product [Rotaria sp. Silwood1]|nr:unnamed protein product [Rotaria sp. Silwood1]